MYVYNIDRNKVVVLTIRSSRDEPRNNASSLELITARWALYLSLQCCKPWF